MKQRLFEASALAKQGWLIARRAVRGRPEGVELEHGSNSNGVVVFVHGYFAAGPVFDPLRNRVEAHLEVPTLDITYGPHRSFESVAIELADRIRRTGVPPKDVAIVGHSLGGLVARWYLQVLGGNARQLVTLATPHGGTRSARRVPGGKVPGGLGAALSPGSTVLERLGDCVGVPHLAIVGGQDRLVPRASAGAVRDARVEVFESLGHNALLYDPRVHQRVLEALE